MFTSFTSSISRSETAIAAFSAFLISNILIYGILYMPAIADTESHYEQSLREKARATAIRKSRIAWQRRWKDLLNNRVTYREAPTVPTVIEAPASPPPCVKKCPVPKIRPKNIRHVDVQVPRADPRKPVQVENKPAEELAGGPDEALMPRIDELMMIPILAAINPVNSDDRNGHRQNIRGNIRGSIPEGLPIVLTQYQYGEHAAEKKGEMRLVRVDARTQQVQQKSHAAKRIARRNASWRHIANRSQSTLLSWIFGLR